MDLLFFLRERVAFVRGFHDTAAQPFAERKRQIEEGEEPYPSQSWDESGEPPYLSEWQAADDGLDMLGQMCGSMLASALHLYLKVWERGLKLDCPQCSRQAFKDGWINGYRHCFAERLNIDWATSPVDLARLEELVMARNRIQHPEQLASPRVTHSAHDLAKLPAPYFVDDREMELIKGTGAQQSAWVYMPTVKISTEKLHGAADMVEQFCDWLERRLAERDLSV